MANVNTSIVTAATIRNLLTSLKETENYVHLKDGAVAYNVNLYWDGGEYYIAYTTTDTGADITIATLDSVLPIQIKPIAPSAS